MNRASRIAARLAAYPLLLGAGAAFVFFWIYSHPRRYVSRHHPEKLGLTVEPLKLRTDDGVNLDAWFVPHPSSKKTVIICHGYPMDKGDVLGMTAFLSLEFNLLYFDFRATGRSGGFFITGGARETRDIDAAVKYLQGRGLGEGIGLFGFSMGAATSLLAQNPALKAKVADAPFASLSAQMDYVFRDFGFWRRPLLYGMKAWARLLAGLNFDGVNPAEAAAAYPGPTLVIHGDADTIVPVENAAAIKRAAPRTELWIIKNAGHGETYFAAGREYRERVTAFYKRHL